MTGETQLLERLRSRDRQAQGELWQREKPRLMGIVVPILRSRPASEALVADLLTDFLYTHVDNVRSERAITAYLRIMAVRRARRHMTHQRRAQPLEEETIEQRDADPDKALDLQRWGKWLAHCLAKLSEKARVVLRLRYGHDLSYHGVGEHLGTSKQAAGKLGKKSLEALRRCLERGGGDA